MASGELREIAIEEKRAEADLLCAHCPHDAKCYKASGDWIPCQDYLKIAGKEKIVKNVEFHDEYFYDDDTLE